MKNPQFAKFDELLVYIAERSADDPNFADLKLNKLLFYVDVDSYRKRGKTITGTRYQHLEHGPASRSLLPARDKLIEAGALDIEYRWRFSKKQTVTVAKRKADRSILDTEDRAIADEVLARFRELNGTDLEQLSHKEPGYLMTTDRQDIPLETALLVSMPSPDAVRKGQALAARFGW
jgi:uncharacterized phage-associated protein